jgi:hypothetical protein
MNHARAVPHATAEVTTYQSLVAAHGHIGTEHRRSIRLC